MMSHPGLAEWPDIWHTLPALKGSLHACHDCQQYYEHLRDSCDKPHVICITTSFVVLLSINFLLL